MLTKVKMRSGVGLSTILILYSLDSRFSLTAFPPSMQSIPSSCSDRHLAALDGDLDGPLRLGQPLPVLKSDKFIPGLMMSMNMLRQASSKSRLSSKLWLLEFEIVLRGGGCVKF